MNSNWRSEEVQRSLKQHHDDDDNEKKAGCCDVVAAVLPVSWYPLFLSSCLLQNDDDDDDDDEKRDFWQDKRQRKLQYCEQIVNARDQHSLADASVVDSTNQSTSDVHEEESQNQKRRSEIRENFSSHLKSSLLHSLCDLFLLFFVCVCVSPFPYSVSFSDLQSLNVVQRDS